MRTVSILLAAVVFAAVTPELAAQRRGGGLRATLAIVVADPAAAPISNVLVTLEGPSSKSGRTEAGRLVFEDLPVGTYRLSFEREGYIAYEREIMARAGKPIDVKVTLKPVPAPAAPPPPPAAVEPPKPSVSTSGARPLVFDVPAVFEKEFQRRGPGRTSALACAGASSALLMQVRDPITEHAHSGADEYLYVIGGEGMVRVGDRHESMKAGVLMFIPRGVPHAITASRSPLVLLSTRAGEGCQSNF